jgi:hypothetical protein
MKLYAIYILNRALERYALTNRGRMTDEQRRGMFAAKGKGPAGPDPSARRGGPALVRLGKDGNNIAPAAGVGAGIVSTTGPGITRTTETGFPRPAPQAGAVTGPTPDQLRRPDPLAGITPGSGRKGPDAPPAPVQGPKESARSYNQRLAEWEKKYSPDHALKPTGWIKPGKPAAPGKPVKPVKPKPGDNGQPQMPKKPTPPRKPEPKIPGALDDAGYVSTFRKKATPDPRMSALARFQALPTSMGRR